MYNMRTTDTYMKINMGIYNLRLHFIIHAYLYLEASSQV